MLTIFRFGSNEKHSARQGRRAVRLAGRPSARAGGKSLPLLRREPFFCRKHPRNERCWFTTPFQAVGSSPAPAGVSKRPPPSRLNERRSARTSLSFVELPFGRQYSPQLFEALHLEGASSPPLCPLLPSPIHRAIT